MSSVIRNWLLNLLYLEEDFGFSQLVVSVSHDSSTDLVGGLFAVDHVRRSDATHQQSEMGTRKVNKCTNTRQDELVS